MKYNCKYIVNKKIKENLVFNLYHLKWYLKFNGFIYDDINIIKYKKNVVLSGTNTFNTPFKILINKIH
mgnify:FL=1